jgi:hypothetical protein
MLKIGSELEAYATENKPTLPLSAFGFEFPTDNPFWKTSGPTITATVFPCGAFQRIMKDSFAIILRK